MLLCLSCDLESDWRSPLNVVSSHLTTENQNRSASAGKEKMARYLQLVSIDSVVE